MNFLAISVVYHLTCPLTRLSDKLLDPDFTRDPLPGVEYICITHAHNDHIQRVAEVPSGVVLASPDVCKIAASLGVPRERLHPVRPGEQVENIRVLPGYSQANGMLYTLMVLLFKRRMPEPAGTPLSFLVEDEASLLHIGDAHEAHLAVHPDILCLPWRTTPIQLERYKRTLLQMANGFSPSYILPIHHDLPHTQADPREIEGRVNAVMLDGHGWYGFQNKKKLE